MSSFVHPFEAQPVLPTKAMKPNCSSPLCKAVLVGTAVVAISALAYVLYTSYYDDPKKKQVGEVFAPGVPKEKGPPSSYLAPNLEPPANTKQASTYATGPTDGGAPSVTLVIPQ